eukprot:16027092-Heterocapsa_arctica.AAC.1
MEHYEGYVKTLEKDMIDADGANIDVMKKIEVDDEEYIILFPGHMGTGDKEEKMEHYKENGE